jgi:hypothetical protein
MILNAVQSQIFDEDINISSLKRVISRKLSHQYSDFVVDIFLA